jgi:hypothetical protein
MARAGHFWLRPSIGLACGETSRCRAVGNGDHVVYRQKLGPGQAGAHALRASDRVGIQVVGYGAATSYMYPGGLDLANIGPPPIR